MDDTFERFITIIFFISATLLVVFMGRMEYLKNFAPTIEWPTGNTSLYSIENGTTNEFRLVLHADHSVTWKIK